MGPLEYIYFAGLSVKRYFSINNRRRLPFRVISIGNITAGGTGKTPAAIAIAEEAKRRGLMPVILTRGYKGTAKGPCFVSKGSGPLLTAQEAGDEPYLMSVSLDGVPIVKSADRYRGGIFAIRELGLQDPSTTLFILDDGFQHWKLFRDRDILLINAENPFGSRRLLPVGRLREPLKELCRADVIVITKSSREDMGLISEIRKYNSRAPIFFAGHKTASLRTSSGEAKPLEWLQGKKIYGFCGLAEPEAFRQTLISLGADIRGFRAFADHHGFSGEELHQLKEESRRSGADILTTTAKDMARLSSLDLPENILIIEIKFIADVPFFESIFA